MSTRSLAFLLVALGTFAPHTATAQSPQVPVRATDAILVKEGRFQYVDFLLTNDTPLAITAWGVGYQGTRSDGAVRTGGFGTDQYKQLTLGCQSQELQKCYVPGGQSTRVQFMASAEEFASITLELTFAVFSDGSGIGDDRERRHLFELRNAEYLGWNEVLSILESAREQAGPGVEGAKAAMQVLGPYAVQGREEPLKARQHSPYWQTSVNLRNGLQPTRVLDDLIAMARKEIEMLQPHLTARPSSFER